MTPATLHSSRAPGQTLATPEGRRAFRRRLTSWFRDACRDLPWRRTSDPYAVWISEIMLQQTQVATVIPYYERFLRAFPNPQSLAAAPEEQVLRLWEGLGYYRRARGMHRAAQVIASEHGGRFPRDLEAIRRLPGVGRYTAGAIASIAFDSPAPILEANTVRLYSRLLGYRGDATSAAGQKTLWRFAEEILPRRGAGEINQALMELGSLVCTPRAPRCDECPARAFCRAARSGKPEAFPARRAKLEIEDVHEVAVVIWRGGKALVRQRPPGERWAGLWDFVRFAAPADSRNAQKEIAARARELSGLTVEITECLGTIKHSITRYRVTLDCYLAQVRGGKLTKTPGVAYRWLSPSELNGIPLTRPARRLAALLAE